MNNTLVDRLVALLPNGNRGNLDLSINTSDLWLGAIGGAKPLAVWCEEDPEQAISMVVDELASAAAPWPPYDGLLSTCVAAHRAFWEIRPQVAASVRAAISA